MNLGYYKFVLSSSLKVDQYSVNMAKTIEPSQLFKNVDPYISVTIIVRKQDILQNLPNSDCFASPTLFIRFEVSLPR